MPRALRIPELAQRDRFLRAVAASGRVYVVASGDGKPVSLDSPSMPGRQVVLAWSSRREAARWADVLAQTPQVVQLSLGSFIAQTLPRLAARNTLIGIDWGAEPIEPELAPADLASRLSIEAADTFLARATAAGALWILENADGPACIGSGREAHAAERHTTSGRIVLPCWTSRADAERHAVAPWTGAVAMPIPLANFVHLTLPWLAEQGWLVAAAAAEEPHGLELVPRTVMARLAAYFPVAAERPQRCVARSASLIRHSLSSIRPDCRLRSRGALAIDGGWILQLPHGQEVTPP